MYSIIYIVIGIVNGYLIVTCIGDICRNVELNAEELYVIEALECIGELGNGLTVYHCSRGNNDLYLRSFDSISAADRALIVIFHDLKAVLILAGFGVGRANNYHVDVLIKRVGREMLVSVVHKYFVNAIEIKVLFIYCNANRIISVRLVIIEIPESYDKIVISGIADRVS